MTVTLMHKEIQKQLGIVDKLIAYYEENPKRWVRHTGRKENAKGQMLGCCIAGGIAHFAKHDTMLTLDITTKMQKLLDTGSIVMWNDTVCKNAKQAISFLKKTSKAFRNEIRKGS